MRIVWLSPLRPGGDEPQEAAAEGRLLRQVAADHDVHVVSASLPPGEVSLAVDGRTLTAEGVNWWPHYPRTLLTWALRTACPGPPMDVRATRSRSRGLAEVVRRRLEREPADLVVVTATELAPAGCTGAAPMALLLPRGFVARCQARAADPSGGVLRRLRWRVDARRAARWERRWGRRAAGVACTNPGDHSVLTRVVGEDVRLVMPGDAGALQAWLAEVGPAVAARADRRRAAAVPPSGEANGPAIATVVVCTRERPRLLEETLPTVAAAAQRVAGTGLVVVEQGRPAAAAICARLNVEAQVLHDDGVGAARGRNLGARKAGGSVVLFTDDDCAVPAEWVRDHLEAMAEPDVVASFGVVDGVSRFSTQAPDPVAWPALHHAGSPPWAIGHSSNMAVRRDALLEVGGFDERFGPGSPRGVLGEDAELIVRLLRCGGTIRSGTGAPVRHLEWRSPQEHYRNLTAYERGAGAWIGKLLREDRPAAMLAVRERNELWRDRLHHSPGFRAALGPALRSTGAFLRGLVFGVRLTAWPPAGRREAPGR